MRDINLIVIHCSASPNGAQHDVRDIDRWHRERGWSGVGYHYVIPCTGDVQHGRSIHQAGAHAKGHNANSIGICLIGTDQFAHAQWDALAATVQTLTHVYSGVSIVGHRDLPNVAKTCPGFDVADWIASGFMPPNDHIL